MLPHTLSLFSAQKILKVNELYEFQILVLVFDCLSGISPPSFRNLFTYNSDIYQTLSAVTFNHEHQEESNSNLFLPYSRTNYGLKSIKVIGPKLWNVVPLAIERLTIEIVSKYT